MLKVLGVLVGAFLLLGLGFIEPTRNVDEGLRGLIITVGVLICGVIAAYGVRYVLRQRREMSHED